MGWLEGRQKGSVERGVRDRTGENGRGRMRGDVERKSVRGKDEVSGVTGYHATSTAKEGNDLNIRTFLSVSAPATQQILEFTLEFIPASLVK